MSKCPAEEGQSVSTEGSLGSPERLSKEMERSLWSRWWWDVEAGVWRDLGTSPLWTDARGQGLVRGSLGVGRKQNAERERSGGGRCAGGSDGQTNARGIEGNPHLFKMAHVRRARLPPPGKVPGNSSFGKNLGRLPRGCISQMGGERNQSKVEVKI